MFTSKITILIKSFDEVAMNVDRIFYMIESICEIFMCNVRSLLIRDNKIESLKVAKKYIQHNFFSLDVSSDMPSTIWPCGRCLIGLGCVIILNFLPFF